MKLTFYILFVIINNSGLSFSFNNDSLNVFVLSSVGEKTKVRGGGASSSSSYSYTKNYEITKDTLINNYIYHSTSDFPNNYFRYDTLEQKYYVFNGDSDLVYIDFSLSQNATFQQPRPPNLTSYYTANIFIDTVSIYGQNVKRFRIRTYPGSTLRVSKYYVEKFGFAGSLSENAGPGSYVIHEILIETLVKNSNGNFDFYFLNRIPEIEFSPINTIYTNNVLIKCKVKHPNNSLRFLFGDTLIAINYIDSVFVEFKYYNESDSSEINTFPLYLQNYKFEYLNSNIFDIEKLLNGYKILYKIIAKDLTIIPNYVSMPEQGYYEMVFNPTVSVSDNINEFFSFSLSQNFPNPFNPTTKISWQLAVSGKTELKVFDVLGREVATLVNNYLEQGNHSVEINSDEYKLNSGVYFYQLRAGEFVETRKMLLMK